MKTTHSDALTLTHALLSTYKLGTAINNFLSTLYILNISHIALGQLYQQPNFINPYMIKIQLLHALLSFTQMPHSNHLVHAPSTLYKSTLHFPYSIMAHSFPSQIFSTNALSCNWSATHNRLIPHWLRQSHMSHFLSYRKIIHAPHQSTGTTPATQDLFNRLINHNNITPPGTTIL